MSAKILLGGMIAASVLAVGWAGRDRAEPVPLVHAAVPEVPWLSKAAAAQIVAQGGALGPLFEGVELGGDAPSAEVRARIAAFAREHHVTIDLAIAKGTLEAIHFAVEYSGCCGYEGAETLALRADRPMIGGGCMGGERKWVTDWAVSPTDDVFVRARVNVNRVEMQWQRALTIEEVLARAETVPLGQSVTAMRAAGIGISSVDGHHGIELPYVFGGYEPALAVYGQDRVLMLEPDYDTDDRRIVSVSFRLHRGDGERTVAQHLRAHWGRPRVRGTTWTWQTAERTIVAELYDETSAEIIVRRRG